RNSSHRSNEIAVDAGWIESEVDPEWSIEHGHHDLQLDTGAHPQARVRAGQELRRQSLYQTGSHDSPFEFPFLQYPGVACVHERNQRNDLTDDGNPVLQIEYRLSVSANIHDVVVKFIHGPRRYRVGHGQCSRDKRNRSECAEIETANIKITANE